MNKDFFDKTDMKEITLLSMSWFGLLLTMSKMEKFNMVNNKYLITLILKASYFNIFKRKYVDWTRDSLTMTFALPLLFLEKQRLGQSLLLTGGFLPLSFVF